jgi:hypothetical protein
MPMTTRCWIAVVAARKPDVCGAMNATTNRSAARRRLRCCRGEHPGTPRPGSTGFLEADDFAGGERVRRRRHRTVGDDGSVLKRGHPARPGSGYG